MDSCFPDDYILAQMIEDKFDACDKGLKNLCQSKTLKASERFSESVRACRSNNAVQKAILAMDN